MKETDKTNVHWAKKLQEENKRLSAALDYLRLQLRIIPQSRFDKYRTAKESSETMAYRKCAKEVDTRCLGAISVSYEIVDGETLWDGSDITSPH